MQFNHTFTSNTLLFLQGKLYMIMEICRVFDGIFKEHLDGVYVSVTSYAVFFML